MKFPSIFRGLIKFHLCPTSFVYFAAVTKYMCITKKLHEMPLVVLLEFASINYGRIR